MKKLTQGLSKKLLSAPELEPVRTMSAVSPSIYAGMLRAPVADAATWAFPRFINDHAAIVTIGME